MTSHMSLHDEASRRRTFAIISHPDAGKTTLTEKLLLYANAIHLAGSVKSKRQSRGTVSDWMAMERERGISISSSVLQFESGQSAINLLDTPGHADFSEDTYRTLAAVDSALMLIDHAKGVEARTRKLFDVCRMRRLPVISFMNKLDRDGLDPIALLDEVSEALDIRIAPLNWPIGMGRDFKGIVDLHSKKVHLFQAAKHGSQILESRSLLLEEAEEFLGAACFEKLQEELELIQGAGDPFTQDDFLEGKVSPVFWGSAMTNFGVEALLDFIAEFAAPPRARESIDGESIAPTNNHFSGFIFKIQANMNPRHRDRIAFMRVQSGKFYRGMDVKIGRTGGTLKLAKPHTFMAGERSIVDHAWPGDIVGLYDPGKLRVGDTLSTGKVLCYAGIPRFAPEYFRRAQLKDPLKRKALDKGLDELSHEGVIQLFYSETWGRQDPVLGAVGLLQFEVLKARLQNEYKVNADFINSPFTLARWIGGEPEGLAWLKERRDYPLVQDRHGQPVVLCESPWSLQYALDNAKGLQLFDVEPL
jgi:peptide chain release factor 3